MDPTEMDRLTHLEELVMHLDHELRTWQAAAIAEQRRVDQLERRVQELIARLNRQAEDHNESFDEYEG